MSGVIRQAVVLVGGRGTRLNTLTVDTPKPLLCVTEGLRFLDLLLRNVARQGFVDIVLLAGHLGEQIRAQYDGQMILSSRIRVLVEPEPLGTAGALMFARDILADRFLMMNGDSLFDINMRAFAADAIAHKAVATLALRRVANPGSYGTVELKNDRVTAFREKDYNTVGTQLINGGIYLLDKAILHRITSLPASIEKDVFPLLVREGTVRGLEFRGYFLDIGTPETLEQGRRELIGVVRRPAAFLDRDGVINVDKNYVHRPDQIFWVDGALAAIRRLNDSGFYVFVVTNQAGVARGYYPEAMVRALHAWMSDRFAEQGAYADDFYYSPFHSEAVSDAYRVQDHPDRKPNPGMLLRAMREWPVDVGRSFLVGDQPSDIDAARRAGIPGHLFRGGNLDTFVGRLLER
jgi:D,D-heptose 1,7-bisphosphate phosphatase